MRNIITLKLSRFLLVSIMILSAAPLFAGNPILDSIRELENCGYYIHAWDIADSNQIRMILTKRDIDRYNYYNFHAELDPTKGLITKLSEIPRIYFHGGSNQSVFAPQGLFCEYWGDCETEFWYYTYDPETNKLHHKELEKKWYCGVPGALNISPNTNIIFLKPPRGSGSINPYLIHDLKSNKLHYNEIRNSNGRIFPDNLAVFPLENGELLLIGQGCWLDSSNLEPLCGIEIYRFDIRKRKLTYSIRIELDSLKSAGALFLPCVVDPRIIEKNCRIFYLMQNISERKIDQKKRESIFIELDSMGNLTNNSGESQLTFGFNEIRDIPEQYVLIKDLDGPSSEFWLMSFDEYPNLIIDKGE